MSVTIVEGLLDAAIRQAERVVALQREIALLKLDVEAQEALQVSAYRAVVQFGWNCGFCNATDRYQEAMQGTEHIAELRRIREARAALTGDGK